MGGEPPHASGLAKAALVAAAPDMEEIATPVEAVPKVVAHAIAAAGPKQATPAPARAPAPAVDPATRFILGSEQISSQSFPVISLS